MELFTKKKSKKKVCHTMCGMWYNNNNIVIIKIQSKNMFLIGIMYYIIKEHIVGIQQYLKRHIQF